jgi:LytR cell envelope-related transcriptional attenuator
VTTWTVNRIVILVAAVAVGAFMLKQGFPINSSQAITGSPRPKASPSPRASSAPTTSPSPSRKARVKGVVVLVLNGSGTTGLAASTAQTLRSKGYSIPASNVGNAKTTATTTVYYRADSLPEAELLRTRYFPRALLRPMPKSFPRTVEVAVVLGTDFASSPSP